MLPSRDRPDKQLARYQGIFGIGARLDTRYPVKYPTDIRLDMLDIGSNGYLPGRIKMKSTESMVARDAAVARPREVEDPRRPGVRLD